jgi:hypothetical protein
MKNARTVDVHKACTMYGTDNIFNGTHETSDIPRLRIQIS